jgi:ligand-binding sensor domain-containing protein
MFRCLIRNCLLLFAVLPAVAGADTKPAWQQIAQCRTITCQAFDDSICWIGTDECGLARFSPLSGQMRFFTNQNSDLPSNSVNCLAFDRERVMWIATDEGLARFDGQAWRIFRADNAPFPANSVSTVACDDSGGIWAGFTGGGVLVYSQNKWTDLLQKQPGYPLTLAYNAVLAIAPVNNHNAWISWNPYFDDSYGLAYLDDKGWHAYGYAGVRWMAADRNGAAWFCVYEWTGTRYRSGLIRLRYPDSLATYLAPESFFPSNTYTYNYLTAVAIDEGGKKWAGAGNGMLCLGDTAWTRLPLIQDTASAKGSVSSIAFDKTGRTWAGFNRTNMDPVVACLVDSATWTRYPVHGTDIPFNEVRFISPIHNDSAWVGSQSQVVRYGSGQWESTPFVDSIFHATYFACNFCPDGKGGVWMIKASCIIHGDGHSWTAFYPTALSTFSSTVLYTDDRGIIWAGSAYTGAGYSLIGFDTLANVVEQKDSLPSDITGITRTPDGTLWAGLSYSGLLCRAANGSWTRVTKSNSALPSDTITGILPGPNGKLWAGTKDRGLACFSNGQWTSFDTLNSDIPGQYAKPLCFDSSGNLWLFTQSTVGKCVYRSSFFSPSPSLIWYCYDAAVPLGLVKFDGLNWTVYNTINSGLPSNNVYTAIAADSGRIWVGTDKGLARFNANYKDAIYQGMRPHTRPGVDANQIRIHIRSGIVTLHAALPYIVSVLVFDAAGRKVCATGDASAANGKAAISLSRLSPGFYIARMTMRPVDGQSAVVQRHFVVPGN